MQSRFVFVLVLIVASLAAGYLARKSKRVPDAVAHWLMTAVAVFGYPAIGLLAIWAIKVQGSDAWLPVAGGIQMLLFAAIGLAVAPLATRDRAERGLLGIVCATPNNGITMGGLVCYLILGEKGLGLSNIHTVAYFPMLVLAMYPLARHYAAAGGFQGSLGRLMLTSLFDWRSLGLPAILVGLALSMWGPPRPSFISDFSVMDILMVVVNVAAYFAIGLRLSLSAMPGLWRMIAAQGFVRFALGLTFGLAAVALTALTAWPMSREAGQVLCVQSSVSSGVVTVAIATMFGLRPKEASVLFVANTVLYLAVMLPVVTWLFGHT